MKTYVIIFISLFVTITKAQVGINTTNPNASLEIRSENQANPSNTQGILIPKIDAFPAINPTAAQEGMMVYLTTTNGSNVPGFYFWDNTSTTWKPVGNEQDRDFLKVGTSEASTNFLDNKYTFGNNGFGTTTPARRLHVSNGVSGATSSGSTGILVESNANVYQHFLTPSTAENGLLFGTDTNSLGSGIIYNNVSNPDGFQFRAGGNFTRMTLTNTGNLGIGTIAPARRLHVANGASGATSNANAGVVVESNGNVFQHFLTPSTAENGLLFGTNASSIGASLIFNNTSTLNGFQFRTGGNFTRMTLTNNGNLGIGTTTPNGILDLNANNRGVLIPRVALTASNVASPIINPNGGAILESTLVYNTASAGTTPNEVVPGFYYWDNTKWARLGNENKTRYYTAVGTTNSIYTVGSGPQTIAQMTLTFTPTNNMVVVNFNASGSVFSNFLQSTNVESAPLNFGLVLNGTLVRPFFTMVNTVTSAANIGHWNVDFKFPITVQAGISQTVSIQYLPTGNNPFITGDIIRSLVVLDGTEAGTTILHHRLLTVIDP